MNSFQAYRSTGGGPAESGGVAAATAAAFASKPPNAIALIRRLTALQGAASGGARPRESGLDVLRRGLRAVHHFFRQVLQAGGGRQEFALRAAPRVNGFQLEVGLRRAHVPGGGLFVLLNQASFRFGQMVIDLVHV